MFAIPISLFAVRKKQFMGSIPGAVITFVVFCSLISYVVMQTNNMYGYKLDKYSSLNMANDFREHYDFKMKDFNFIPSFEIKILSGQSTQLDELAKYSDEIDIWDAPVNSKPTPKIDM